MQERSSEPKLVLKLEIVNISCFLNRIFPCRRDPASYVKPKNTVTDSNNNVDPGTESGSRSEIEKMTPHVSRHIFLIRHGHYNINGEADEERGLTELGKQRIGVESCDI